MIATVCDNCEKVVDEIEHIHYEGYIHEKERPEAGIKLKSIDLCCECMKTHTVMFNEDDLYIVRVK